LKQLEEARNAKDLAKIKDLTAEMKKVQDELLKMDEEAR
jgi:hypothetical protein